MSIFVAIAAYRDPHLWKTVENCLAQAADPMALRFGIVEQSETPSRLPAALNSRVRYLHVHHRFSRGVCWARAMTFGLYNNEDYLLQIDSHMLFAKGWDRRLLSDMEVLSRADPRVVISTYPYGFEIVEGGVMPQAVPGQNLVLRPRADSTFRNGSPVLMFEAVPVATNQPLRGFHVAAGCLFTRGGFVDAVPYDPRLYFHGEEQNLAIRAWTQGWNLFHVPDMPILHLYKRPDVNASVHWNPKDDAERAFTFSELEQASVARMTDLLVKGVDLGRYGLGTARTLAEFAAFSGLDYPNLRMERRPAV